MFDRHKDGSFARLISVQFVHNQTAHFLRRSLFFGFIPIKPQDRCLGCVFSEKRWVFMGIVILVMFLFFSCCSLKRDKEVVKDIEDTLDDLETLEEAVTS